MKHLTWIALLLSLSAYASVTTSNMSLLIPSVGETDYPTSISTSFNLIDAHDHSSGKGVTLGTNAVPTAALQASAVTTAKINDSAVTTAKVNDAAVTLAKLASDVAASLVPAGSVMSYVGTSAPTGWLMCDGSAVSRVTYAALFAVIGTSHGSGDGSTTFNLPDYRGRFLRGLDGSAGRDPDDSSRTAMNSGGNTGDAVGSVQSDQFGSHSHTVSNLLNPNYSFREGSGTILFNANLGGSPAATVSSAGGNETRPKNAFVNFIVKH